MMGGRGVVLLGSLCIIVAPAIGYLAVYWAGLLIVKGKHRDQRSQAHSLAGGSRRRRARGCEAPGGHEQARGRLSLRDRIKGRALRFPWVQRRVVARALRRFELELEAAKRG